MTDHPAMTDYGFTTLETTLDDRILRVAFNRPDRLNALDAVMHDELRELFGRIERDNEVDVVVLTGNGKAFCVGADFDQMEENLARGGYEDGHPSLLGDAASMARNILAVRQPMIAAINGDCIGLGATLALFCDITLHGRGRRASATRTSSAGIVAGDGGPVLWPMLVGPNRAKEYLLTGDLLTAAEAERIGLVNHVVRARRARGRRRRRPRASSPPARRSRSASTSASSTRSSRRRSTGSTTSRSPSRPSPSRPPTTRKPCKAFLEKRKPGLRPDPSD